MSDPVVVPESNVFTGTEPDPVAQAEEEMRRETILQARKMFNKLSELLVPSNNVIRVLRTIVGTAAQYNKIITLLGPSGTISPNKFRTLEDDDSTGINEGDPFLQSADSSISAETFGAQAVQQIVSCVKPIIEAFTSPKEDVIPELARVTPASTVTSMDIECLTRAVSDAKRSGMEDIEKELRKTLNTAIENYNTRSEGHNVYPVEPPSSNKPIDLVPDSTSKEDNE